MLGAENVLEPPQSRIETLLTELLENGGAGNLPIASTDRLGGVKVDGTTIQADENGVISLAVAIGDSESY